ncbi:rab-GTPase-TBC domain-domain-containing protein [Yarrowia lipolytica]|uniref:GTPase-activating protein GYP5 n=2 Tax=Yarrowia lipolytica TaxID=4952 RepID=Q6C199_YARLI|nr:YALI0F18106p [Yarrowia lipolytica CLIB122]AOW07346.1 hypothetical protein YALI1_F24079g [Yarrowia lipolytica]KAB8286420.1 rab-GTPase-TBC domain-containing protein [Yarrowia lipolytica]KAE8174319.1 rab-GTPase-TBC domain-containing protein [Yarrowia lipolytica]KAJ8055558.1 rab-GTPase-TBC domain-containing protein [Yarrowia lipolytica]QNQ01069.1 GTPase-activating protein GYP5 [Yarrowia lipolytica]|eukprot:XP_505563.1 YALI0F18106p [Yarrowia lipolytica CLIB122]
MSEKPELVSETESEDDHRYEDTEDVLLGSEDAPTSAAAEEVAGNTSTISIGTAKADDDELPATPKPTSPTSLKVTPGSFPGAAGADEDSTTTPSATSPSANVLNSDGESLTPGTFPDATYDQTPSPVSSAPPPPLPHRPATHGDGGAASARGETPPTLPPRQGAPSLPPRKRSAFSWFLGNKSQTSLKSEDNITALANSHRANAQPAKVDEKIVAEGYGLMYSRMQQNQDSLSEKEERERQAVLQAGELLQEDFRQLRQKESLENPFIDWDFWSRVIEDYATVAKEHPKQLKEAISAGFPTELRSIIWQIITSSKNAALQDFYTEILKESTPHEKAIRRDLSRTSFVMETSPDSLYNVIKAYSLFDPEVGYTQGMAFVTTPLLLTLNEVDAFCLLVRLLKDYELRTMFLQEMPGLHLKLYQFDRLLEDQVPSVHIHLTRQGVKSSMYASQWFLTLFAYKFPLSMVLRIFDIIMTEGIEAILKFGVALIRKNADTILALKFDHLLPFLKESIFDVYREGAGDVFRVNEFVRDAMDVKIHPLLLHKYQEEYLEINRLERERLEEVEALRLANGQLTLQVRRIESTLVALEKEHIEVANEMVQGKVKLASLQDENETLNMQVSEMRRITGDEDLEALMDLRQDNERLVAENEQLQSQMTEMKQELDEIRGKHGELDAQHTNLKSKWGDMRKLLDAMPQE